VNLKGSCPSTLNTQWSVLERLLSVCCFLIQEHCSGLYEFPCSYNVVYKLIYFVKINAGNIQVKEKFSKFSQVSEVELANSKKEPSSYQ
jgi:hypothetical protein